MAKSARERLDEMMQDYRQTQAVVYDYVDSSFQLYGGFGAATGFLQEGRIAPPI
jgi:hypothetical protein